MRDISWVIKKTSLCIYKYNSPYLFRIYRSTVPSSPTRRFHSILCLETNSLEKPKPLTLILLHLNTIHEIHNKVDQEYLQDTIYIPICLYSSDSQSHQFIERITRCRLGCEFDRTEICPNYNVAKGEIFNHFTILKFKERIQTEKRL